MHSLLARIPSRLDIDEFDNSSRCCHTVGILYGKGMLPSAHAYNSHTIFFSRQEVICAVRVGALPDVKLGFALISYVFPYPDGDAEWSETRGTHEVTIDIVRRSSTNADL